jgi:hypothetical protein
MAMLVYLTKESESGSQVRYRFHPQDGEARFLTLDKDAETIKPDDGNTDGVFRAAAGKLAKAWTETGEAPEKLTHQS